MQRNLDGDSEQLCCSKLAQYCADEITHIPGGRGRGEGGGIACSSISRHRIVLFWSSHRLERLRPSSNWTLSSIILTIESWLVRSITFVRNKRRGAWILLYKLYLIFFLFYQPDLYPTKRWFTSDSSFIIPHRNFFFSYRRV